MKPEGPFYGKVALVTGGGRGIGRAIALELASQGADVVINYVRNQAPAEEVVQKITAMGRRARKTSKKYLPTFRKVIKAWISSSAMPPPVSTDRPCSRKRVAGTIP